MAACYYHELLHHFSRSMQDRDAAADIVQEAYARLLALQRNGQAVTDARALLYRTARNLVIDQYRRAEVRRHEDIDVLTESDQPHAPRHLQPDEILASAQVIRSYVGAIETLPPRCREAFVLYVFDELTHAQIAERMGISSSMVEKHVVRGMLVCRRCERELRAPQTVAELSPVDTASQQQSGFLVLEG